MGLETVRAKLDTLPSAPGVYLFRDRQGRVLYVGKARSLRSRVRSYFQPGTGDERAFVARLEGEVADLETYVVDTEKEAALLENQLIKEKRPRYNVKLRDDKDYLSLRLDPEAPWPRLEVVRRPRPDGALYFGPYHSASSARQTLRLVNRHFQLRTCTDADFRTRARPCLQHQIRRCPAPCVLPVDREAYGEQVRNVALFLDGRHDELVEHLEARMREAAAAQQYEMAAVHRDQLRAVERVREAQRVAVVRDVDQDVIGLHRQADQAEVAVLQIRSGKLVSVKTFGLDEVSLPDAELVGSFVAEYYDRGSFVPDEVLVPMALEAMDGLAEMLGERRGRRVRIAAPRRGPRTRLVRMAADNAAHSFREKRRAEQNVDERLEAVQRELGLPAPPRRIECVDISHLGGEHTVASVVALRDGAPDRRRYRSFHVKGVSGGDDYGAMREVLSRRLARGRGKEQGWELPDLLVVDGGKGQLGVATAVLEDLGLTDLPVAALAKEKENVAGDVLVDRVYLPGRKNPVPVRSSPALSMLALARDEAHRASNALREKLGKRSRIRSGLDAVPGVGPKTRRRLLAALGSMRAVQEADEAALVRAGATRRQARAIREAFDPQGGGDEGAVEERAVENAFH
ncbi:MAG: excinuclease ABC subunit UvrC [Myxococcota bacterium]